MKLKKYYEDPQVLHVGTMETRSWYVPYPADQAKSGETKENLSDIIPWEKSLACQHSKEVTDLSGEWRFAYYERPELVPESFAAGKGTEGWKTIPVPSVIQSQGYDQPQYINLCYPIPYDPPYVPLENPAAAYARTFRLTAKEKGRRQFLYFSGVDSCFYVWVNGQEVGYSQVSHSPSEFEITDYVKSGENTLSVLVLKYCDGTYLEDQDKFRQTGIFREVLLLSRPAEHLRDYRVRTLSADAKKAVLSFEVLDYAVRSPAKRFVRTGDASLVEIALKSREYPSVHLTLRGAGQVIAAEGDTDRKGKCRLTVKKPLLWNAETPYVYELEITAGEEKIYEQVAIRVLEVKDGVVCLNGQRIKCKGVNRHDSNPYKGAAVELPDVLQDLYLMKQFNINAIRTSHYPNAPWFPVLAEALGFYLIAESDVESHGSAAVYKGSHEHTFGLIAQHPLFKKGIIDRVQRNVLRDKNRGCILIWSMGNECGYGESFEEAARWVKRYDPDRLTHYESSIHTTGTHVNDCTPLDLYSMMYDSVENIDTYFAGDKPRKPYVLCEFIHAMGNGPGDIEDYMERIYRYDGMLGGFVWEWCDHAVVLGQDENGEDKFGYGGDSGEKYHDNNFCVDGLVGPDRVPHMGLLEYGQAIRPARAYLVDGDPALVLLYNMLDFRNLQDAIRMELYLIVNGTSDWGTAVPVPDVEPHKGKFIRLSEIEGFDAHMKAAMDAGADVAIQLRYFPAAEDPEQDLRYIDAVEKDRTLGFDQLEIRVCGSGAAELWEDCFSDGAAGQKKGRKAGKSGKNTEAGGVTWEETTEGYVIRGAGFTYVFNPRTGLFDSMKVGNADKITAPMEWSTFRAPTDNDMHVRHEWYRAGYHAPVPRVYRVEASPSGKREVALEAELSIASVSHQAFLRGKVNWTIAEDGKVSLDLQMQRDPIFPFMPRFGITLAVPEKEERVNYYGYGPFENYLDKHQCSFLGRFSDTVEQLNAVRYLKPQEYGSRRIYAVSAGGFLVRSEQLFSFNISQFGDRQLAAAGHDWELKKPGYNELHLDYKMSGVGSNSCGPALRPAYRLDEEEIRFRLEIKPL